MILKMMRKLLASPLAFLLFATLPTLSGVSRGEETQPDRHWGQWRGPQANGTSATADPPVTWDEDSNVKWKVAIDGRGTSTPIVWGDRVFVLTAIKTDRKDDAIPDPQDQPKTNFFDIKQPNAVHQYVVLCLDRNTGDEVWREMAVVKIPHQGAHNDNDFASASPTTDGKHLICWFGSAGLFCYSLDGDPLWQRDLGEVNVGSSLGEGCSPVLHDEKVVIVRDHAGQSSIEVLDATSGQTLWRKQRDEGNAWATPLITKAAGKTQVITAASNRIRSYDLDSGDIIWQCDGLTGNVTPCPVRLGDHVICMSGYQGYSALALPLDRTGEFTASDHVLWQIDRGTPYIPSPLLYNGLLYFNQSNQNILRCVDAQTGELVFGPERLSDVSNIYASPVGAAGRIYVVGRGGTTMVLKHGRTFEVIAVNQLDERFDASPAVVGDQLILRGSKFLYCIEQ
ncbi:outer membrane biogenesis protein BamB [Stieleria neptunia]|uniref:Outer membrane biogenesis protein BamB n=1 Tax=Stieleria neptunia TaxID=2527979 RepID=A0A518HUV4_9BACT|nr:PQQ-binding-like beta-propeller repeat protein [Stieleria neptunia]QDV44567.1 outer membrane biogenesis protein BamB [Stieleria neptunia]